MRDLARSAENILIPKGDDNRACVEAFQKFTDIEVPTFRGRELMAKSGGRVFWLLKGKDIPGLIASGRGDVGTTGTDSRIEYTWGNPNKNLRFQRIGSEMCRFSLLSLQEEADRIQRQLDNSRSLQTLEVVTSRQKLLEYYLGNLPIVPADVELSGSVEGAMKLVGAPLAADIVDSGNTSLQNGLTEVFELGRMYPDILARVSDESIL